MISRVLPLVVCALLLCQLLAGVDAGKLFERSHVPKGWSSLGTAPSSSPVRFTVGLRSASVSDLSSLFQAVTDPTSESYLDHLTGEEVERRFGASPDDRHRVERWLLDGGVPASSLRHVSSAIEATAPADVVSRLFATEMRLFRHSETRKTVVKAWGAASLPDDVHPSVDLVTGLSSFPVPPRRSHAGGKVGQQAVVEAVIPQTIRTLYQIRDQKPGSSAATQSVIEFEGQWFNNNDTALYARLVGYTGGNATIASIPSEHVVGNNEPTFPGVESSLDVQMIAPTNMEVQTWFWYDGDSSWLYEFALHMLNTTNPPQVNSISYGMWEGMQCWVDPAECELMDLSSDAYTASVNALFMRLGLQGVSLVVASGDSGANSRTDESCAAYNLRPEYPASSPYVTTVGATMLVDASYGYSDLPICAKGNYSCITNGREVAVSRNKAFFTSGGGFSNITGATRPSYQDAAVKAYLASGVDLPPASFYNANGRGEPDVAAVGSQGLLVVDGFIGTEGGTSMASPIFAGVASFLNEIAVSKTGKSLGFLNPLLYKMAADAPDAFHDITEGDNICPEEFCGPKCKGYKATKGWDPVTGLGTPNTARMEAYVSQLMDQVLARRAAKAARESTTIPSAPSQQAQQPTPTPSSSAPAYTHQRRPASSDASHFWSPTTARAAFPQASATPGAQRVGDAQLIQTWQGVQVSDIAVMGNESLVVATATGAVLQVSLASGAIVANYTIDASLQLGGLAASASAAFPLLEDQLYGNVYIDGVDLSSGQRTSRITLGYPTNLGGVDRAGKTALTSAGGSAAVLYDTATGKRQALLYNPAWSVAASALNPANADVWLVSVFNGTASVVVLSAGSNSTRMTVQLPSTVIQVGSVSIDQAGQNAYVLYVTAQGQTTQFVIEQFNADNGQSVRRIVLPSGAQPAQFIAAGPRPGSVIWVNGGLITWTSQDGSSTFALGQYPLISNPTDVAVTAQGNVLVAENMPFQVVEFNTSGGVVERYPVVDEFSVCQEVPYMDVAVDAYGDVLMPVCNATILVMRRGRVVERVYTGNNTMPRSVSAGPRGSILFSDDNHRGQLKQIARNGTVERSWTTPYGNSLLLTVHYANATGEAWAVDTANQVVLRWPLFSGDQPVVWNLTATYGQLISPYSVAVDAVHQSAVVTAANADYSSAWVLWLDLNGQPKYNFSFPNALGFVIPTGVAVSPDGSRVYATDFIQGAVYVFDNSQAQDAQPTLLERVLHRSHRNRRAAVGTQ